LTFSPFSGSVQLLLRALRPIAEIDMKTNIILMQLRYSGIRQGGFRVAAYQFAGPETEHIRPEPLLL
jgi:hypothetical protein